MACRDSQHRSAPAADLSGGSRALLVSTLRRAEGGSPSVTLWVAIRGLRREGTDAHLRLRAAGALTKPGSARRRTPDRGRRMSSYHLVGQQQDGFEAEFPRAEVEEIFQAWSQELHHHDVVVSLGPAPPDGGDAHCKRPRGARSPRVHQVVGGGGLGQKTLAPMLAAYDKPRDQRLLSDRVRWAAVRSDTR